MTTTTNPLNRLTARDWFAGMKTAWDKGDRDTARLCALKLHHEAKQERLRLRHDWLPHVAMVLQATGGAPEGGG